MHQIGDNTREVGLGYVQGSNNVVLPFEFDDTTKELLIEVIPVGSPLSALVADQKIFLDDNTHQIAAAVTNDSNEIITPLTVDEIVGLPCLRIEF